MINPQTLRTQSTWDKDFLNVLKIYLKNGVITIPNIKVNSFSHGEKETTKIAGQKESNVILKLEH